MLLNTSSVLGVCSRCLINEATIIDPILRKYSVN